ncbi:MAG: glycosyltransferase family 2 protein [Clostridiales bacterium]|nr:glycosyltransferase family 2 protein [Clostridiales bacterium]MDU6975016.1 glycosyltransferase family 2 protein [Clostridiales bacterium]
MITEEKISIIIPVYNASEHLYDCLNSIKLQIYKNYEVLIIDDGSTDDSVKICENFIKDDNRFKLVVQKNSGVSNARNKGIQMCSGNWILFIDADDMIFKNTLNTLIQAANESKCLVVQGGITTKLQNKLNSFQCLVYKNYEIAKFLLNPYEYNQLEYYSKAELLHSTQGCYAKLISKDLIKNNKIYFENNLKLGEDLVFYFNILNSTEKVCIVTEKIYFYRINQFSVTHKYNPKLLDNALEFSYYFYQLISSNPKYDKLYNYDMRYQIYFHLRLVIDNYLWNTKQTLNVYKFRKIISEYMSNDIINDSIKIIDIKYTQINILSYQLIRNKLRVIFLKTHNWTLLYILGKLNNCIYKFKDI